MRRRSIPALAVMSCVVSLVGCSAEAPVVSDADSALWSEQQRAAVGDADVLAVLESRVERDEGEDAGEIAVSFDDEVTISGVELRCFGDGSVEGRIDLTSARGSVATTTGALRCSEGMHELDVPAESREGVTRVAFSTVSSTEQGAWQLVVR